ncbi:Hpt domain-containing protein [Pelagibius sp. Alg239-R121]|uniref:Hpt domain-containing protein n=1 Tax=Pelagibius sp. Alg239-R121 TaxID=2993448 RepID=UPI0024A7867D|nr:Hpt domain-containing protein [Pelagibius sp. Alg239-R121]
MTGIDVNAIPTTEELQAMFIEGALEGIAVLERKYAAACAGDLAWPEVILEMRGIAHDIKGQGGSFGYPLITEVGDSLSTLLKHERMQSEAGLKLLAAHITALATILDKAIQGDGGNLGGSYTQRLSALVGEL